MATNPFDDFGMTYSLYFCFVIEKDRYVVVLGVVFLKFGVNHGEGYDIF